MYAYTQFLNGQYSLFIMAEGEREKEMFFAIGRDKTKVEGIIARGSPPTEPFIELKKQEAKP